MGSFYAVDIGAEYCEYILAGREGDYTYMHSEVILLLLHCQVDNTEYLGRAKLKENRQ